MEATVAIPTMNRADDLRELLASLRDQTVSGFATVVVVGPTSDHSCAVAESFGARVVRAGRGVPVARNVALREVKTPFVAFLDDDTLPDADWLEKLLEAAKLHLEAGSIAGKTDFMDGSPQFPRMRVDLGGYAYAEGHDPLPRGETIPYASAGNALFRMAALERIGGWDESFHMHHEDSDVGVRLHRAGYPSVYAPEARVRHKARSGGLRREDDSDWEELIRATTLFSVRHGGWRGLLRPLRSERPRMRQLRDRGRRWAGWVALIEGYRRGIAPPRLGLEARIISHPDATEA